MRSTTSAQKTFPPPHKDLDAKLILKILDVLADPRLRGIKSSRHISQVKIPTNGLPNNTKLLKVHGLGSVLKGY
jgi:hypothetical protein